MFTLTIGISSFRRNARARPFIFSKVKETNNTIQNLYVGTLAYNFYNDLVFS